MKAISAPPGDAAHATAIHLEYIQNQAAWPDGGAEDVAAYHRSLFLHRHGPELERYQQERRIQEDRLAYLEARLSEANQQMVDREPLVPVQVDGRADVEPNAPWNAWDAAMFGACLLGIAGLLVFGVFNISFNLLESGLVTFLEHPVRAYFWAALLPVGALAVKVGWDLLSGPGARSVYMWTCLALGLAGVLAWVGAYATVYPTLSVSTLESIRSLSVHQESAPAGGGSGLFESGAKMVDAIIVGAQAMAEICLSAVLGMYLTIVYARHRRVRWAVNPAYRQMEEARRRWEREVGEVRLALAAAQGGEERLQHQLAALVAFAKSLFHKEAAQRRDRSQHKHRLLEQLTRQIQTQLETADRPDAGEEVSPSSLVFPQTKSTTP